ncbi:YwgA family protein [Amphibacillus sp. MSJ-3]|uniref:YwgA family protein n=1 Tax=Amphibacillus sp. MSJ-3 TaxID=2841505 RepID=UPI001C0EBA11|nr:YwgA family protein [Amphibacillus sp. MSJ-3]MBU5594834.1 YwgA family protein [Amphibacillus sp. MSJ-3]
MLLNHARLMRFFVEAQDIVGRKKLQKMIYILKKTGVPFNEKFAFHFYGPYSEELTLRIEELCNLGFIIEEKQDKGHYSQYHYRISQAGQQFLEQAPDDLPNCKEQIELLNNQRSRFLELVATMLFFEDLPRHEVEKKVQEVKASANYSEEELKEAWQFLDQLQQFH